MNWRTRQPQAMVIILTNYSETTIRVNLSRAIPVGLTAFTCGGNNARIVLTGRAAMLSSKRSRNPTLNRQPQQIFAGYDCGQILTNDPTILK